MRSYIAKHNQDDVVAESRSGGIFTALSDCILEKRGTIYGCRWSEEFKAVHVKATTSDERDLLRKSKYVQSDLGESFLQVEADLLAGNYVLFSGTACQVAGLDKFLNIRKIETSRLFTVDIICHGVPSPKMWRDYLRFSEQKYGGKVIVVESINKKYGWSAHVETLRFDNGIEVDSQIFTLLYGKHNIIRKSCSHCPYKSIVRPSDITIGDAWGIKDNDPEWFDNKGMSLILVNTPKGASILNEVKEKCVLKEVKLSDYMQPALKAPYILPPNRIQFWSDYNRFGFCGVVDRYIELNLFRKIKRKMIRLVEKDTHPEKKLYSEEESRMIQEELEKGYERTDICLTEDGRMCCGCSACALICPRHAISMVEDDEGFLYPRIDENLCVGCKMCMKVCGWKISQHEKWGKLKNERKNS